MRQVYSSVAGGFRRWGGWAAQVAELAAPPRCAACGAIGEPICAPCRRRLPTEYADAPRCDRCWLPTASPAERECAACGRHGSSLQHLRSAFLYEGAARQLILTIKYAPEPRLAPLLLDAAPPLPAGAFGPIDVVAPIPMPIFRRRARGFNQSETFAALLAQRLDAPLDANLLRRRGRHRWVSRTQVGSRDRRAGLRGVFAASERAQGQRVLLVDDVATTTTTLREAASALRAAGAEAVSAWTAARDEAAQPTQSVGRRNHGRA